MDPRGSQEGVISETGVGAQRGGGFKVSGTVDSDYARFRSLPVDFRSLACDVVAFLNSKGGGDIWVTTKESWVGLLSGEKNSALVSEQKKLQLLLEDYIEPRLERIAVNVTVQGESLRIRVAEGGNKPYALTGGGCCCTLCRTYTITEGNHTRLMRRDELAKFFSERAAIGGIP